MHSSLPLLVTLSLAAAPQDDNAWAEWARYEPFMQVLQGDVLEPGAKLTSTSRVRREQLGYAREAESSFDLAVEKLRRGLRMKSCARPEGDHSDRTVVDAVMAKALLLAQAGRSASLGARYPAMSRSCSGATPAARASRQGSTSRRAGVTECGSHRALSRTARVRRSLLHSGAMFLALGSWSGRSSSRGRPHSPSSSRRTSTRSSTRARTRSCCSRRSSTRSGRSSPGRVRIWRNTRTKSGPSSPARTRRSFEPSRTQE